MNKVGSVGISPFKPSFWTSRWRVSDPTNLKTFNHCNVTTLMKPINIAKLPLINNNDKNNNNNKHLYIPYYGQLSFHTNPISKALLSSHCMVRKQREREKVTRPSSHS